MPYNPYMDPGYAGNIQPGTADIFGVTWVSSINEVQAATVPYGKQLFMNRTSDTFYIKDRLGNIKGFSFESIPIPTDPGAYVTKEEFDDLRNKYEQLVLQFSATTTATKQPQPVANNATNEQLQGNTGTSQAAVLQPNSSNGANAVTAQQPA